MSPLSTVQAKDIIGWGAEVIRAECEALEQSATAVGKSFANAVQLALDCKGRVVLTGLGKSGHIAHKISSTLSSTGTPSIFLHPAEALHGDLGALTEQDCLLAIAFGGETAEVLEVVKYAKRIGVKVIALTGKMESTLAKSADVILNGSVAQEACALNLAPTSSSTVALALGDALAVATMRARGFAADDFARLHPSGSLGRKLSRVSDYMRKGAELPTIHINAGFHDVLNKVTNPNFGICAVLNDKQELAGVITDGDLRRALLKFGGSTLEKSAKDLLHKSPKTILASALIQEAVTNMEDFKITALLVVDPAAKPNVVGLLRMHDLLAAKMI